MVSLHSGMGTAILLCSTWMSAFLKSSRSIFINRNFRVIFLRCMCNFLIYFVSSHHFGRSPIIFIFTDIKQRENKRLRFNPLHREESFAAPTADTSHRGAPASIPISSLNPERHRLSVTEDIFIYMNTLTSYLYILYNYTHPL